MSALAAGVYIPAPANATASTNAYVSPVGSGKETLVVPAALISSAAINVRLRPTRSASHPPATLPANRPTLPSAMIRPVAVRLSPRTSARYSVR